MKPPNLKENKFSLLIVFMTSLFLFQTYAQTINGSFDSKFKRYQKNERFTGNQTQQWNAVVWKGERINKQIVLWSDTSISNITYTFSDFNSGNASIPSSNIKLSFGKYVKGDTKARICGGYTAAGTTVRDAGTIDLIDALSDKKIISLTSLKPLINLWITIDVPTTTVAEIYTGKLTVNGGVTTLDFSIELNVVDYTLPDVSDWSFHLDLWQFPANILDRYNDERNRKKTIAAWSEDHFTLLEPAYKLLADAGQKVITAHIKKGALGTTTVSPMVKWTKKLDNSWTYDFTVFKKYVDKLMSWGITKQISCFSPVGWEENDIPYWDEATKKMKVLNAPLNSGTYITRWNHFLTKFKIFLDDQGWFDKTVLYLDEVSETKLQNVYSVINGNNSGWKLGISYSHFLPSEKKNFFYDLSGTLERASKNDNSDDKISTFYTSCSQTKPNNYVTSDNSLAEMTWMAWHSLNEGYDGYLRWAYDYWRLGNPFDARDGSNTAGDFSMIYRELDPEDVRFYKFLPSLRLMMLREGIQDFEKIKILKANPESWSEEYKAAIISLNTTINEFTKTSGLFAEKLIKEGQRKIKEISEIGGATAGVEDVKLKGANVVSPILLTKEKSLILYIPEAKGLKIDFFLFNIIGQIVYKKEYNVFSGKETIDIQNSLTSGIYIVKIVSQKKNYTQKIVITD